MTLQANTRANTQAITGAKARRCALALALGLLVAMATTVVAQKAPAAIDPANLAAAKELMAAQGGIEQARKGLEQTKAAMIAEVRRASPAEADGFARFMDTYLGTGNPKVTAFFEKVLESTTNFYAERCTIEEMKGMTTFLGTPAGKKFIALAPEVAAGLAPHFIEFQKGLMADVQAAAQRGEFKKQ